MDLTQVIETYKGKLAQDPRDAALFILKELQDGESARILNRRYVALFVLNEGGEAYDPTNQRLYEIDPEVVQLDFEPQLGQLVLFQKKGKVVDQRATDLEKQGKLPYVQDLEVVGTGLRLEAHIYNPEIPATREMQKIFADGITEAESLKAAAKTL